MYYYFAATLPMLVFKGELPFSVEDFAGDCRRLLSAEDSRDAALALGLEEGEAGNAALRAWRNFERALKNEIAWARASVRQQNPLSVIKGGRAFDAEVSQMLGQAAKADDPLEAEEMVMRLQWQRLDAMALNQPFSLEYILAYAGKLRILQRLTAFKTDRGPKKLEEMLRGVQEHRTSKNGDDSGEYENRQGRRR